jgi:Nuclease-related domain
MIFGMTVPAVAKRMRLRYAGTCRGCTAALQAGEWAIYFRDAKQVECLACNQAAEVSGADEPATSELAPTEMASEPVPAEAQPGQAGASARREYERRVANREQRIRTAHPRLGGLILALSDEPQSTQAWVRGAIGEEKLARRLDTLVERGARVLHDRRILRSRANIDHLVIAPAGIFVIDAKRYSGRRPDRKVEGGVLRPRTETLMVGRQDCTKLLTGMHKQLELVRAALGQEANLPVHGMLCFIDADWPIFGGNFSIGGVEVLWPNKIAERVFLPASLTEADIAATYNTLATAFPAA